MRTYGRVGSQWFTVTTDANGDNSLVYLTTLCQVLKLNLGESPFYATYGLPQLDSVIQQVFPDYYMGLTQQAFSPYFASLLISRVADNPPTYSVKVMTNQGVRLNTQVAIPT